MDLSELMMELDSSYYLVLENKMSLTVRLDKKVVLHTLHTSHNHTRTKIDSYHSLPLEKILTLHIVTILSKSYNIH